MYRHASLLFVLLSLVGAYPALADEFIIRPSQDKNLVKFTSKAVLETFDGKTRDVSGTLVLDPANLEDSVTVWVEVDLTKLDTGISLRNKHMRQTLSRPGKGFQPSMLETGQAAGQSKKVAPEDASMKAVFEGGRILEASSRRLEPGDKVQLRLAGRFEINGVSRRIEVPVEVTRTMDGLLHVATEFDVALADYQIERPSFLVLKLNETQHITVSVTAHPKP